MGIWARASRALTAWALVATGLVLIPAARAGADPALQPVTVRIMSVECASACTNTGLEDVGKGAPDFYAKITIGSESFTTPRAPDDREKVFIPEGWTMTREVSTALPSVDISVQIWDFDVAPDPNGDDLADTSPRPDDATAKFTLNLVNGDITGDLTSPTGCMFGKGDDQPPVQTCFDIRPYSFQDSDGDSFPDYAEYRGLDFDDDGTIDLHLEHFTDPRRRDLFVEIDWMQGQAPEPGVLPAVEGVFDRAPVKNQLTGADGLALHLLSGEELPYSETLDFDGSSSGADKTFDQLKWGDPAKTCATGGEDGSFGTPADRSSRVCDQILLYKRLHFRYGVFIHGLSPATVTDPVTGLKVPNTMSGMAELDDRGGNDLVVSLGRMTSADLTLYRGLAEVQKATLLHELGHTFGLGHGGRRDNGTFDPVNCKPNYLSVMNYPLQFATDPSAGPGAQLDPDRPLDYQRPGTVPIETLNENALDETKTPGVAGAGTRLIIWGGNGDRRWYHHRADEQINWKIDFLPSPPNPPLTPGPAVFQKPVSIDVNHLTSFTGCATPSPGETLISYPDWDRLVYDFTGSRYFSEGVHGPFLQEITAQDMRRLAAPDLNVTKSVDKTDASPGDRLTYTVRAANAGPGKATAVQLTDTPPSGAATTRDLGELAAGQSSDQTFAYEVPCTVADGDVLANTARITGRNAAGGAEPDEMLGDNTATATTTAHTPVLTLTSTATATANAGEATTHTLTYRNTGSAPATGVVVTDTLPPEVSYSTALDQGTGPKPATVVRNGDSTTTLRWNPGTVAPGATATLSYTTRTSLLTTGGTVVTARATLGYGGAGGCAYPDVTATASSTVTEQRPSRDPWSSLVWPLHQPALTAELLARVQATDPRFDGADGSAPDGVLSKAEVNAVFTLPLLQPRSLRAELLAACLNLADRRINAGTRIVSIAAGGLDLTSVGAAARHAQATLLLPVTPNLLRYTNATLVLSEINLNLSERY